MSKFNTREKQLITKLITELSQKKVKKDVYLTYEEIAEELEDKNFSVTQVYVGMVIRKNKLR